MPSEKIGKQETPEKPKKSKKLGFGFGLESCENSSEKANSEKSQASVEAALFKIPKNGLSSPTHDNPNLNEID